MRIIHTADIHLGMENYGRTDPESGLNSRLLDFLRSFDALIDYSLGKKNKNIDNDYEPQKADLFIFAGDAFKTRDPSPTYQNSFAQRIHRLSSAGIPCVLLVGNHDLPNAFGKANTLDIFRSLEAPNVYVMHEIGLKKIETQTGPIQIVSLPWVYKSEFLSQEEYKNKSPQEINQVLKTKIVDKIKYFINLADQKIPLILAGHATIEGASFGAERQVMLGNDVVIPVGEIINPKIQYVALGHIHKRQIIYHNPYVVYPGSIERVDFSEADDDKGFMSIDIHPSGKKFETTAKFITLKTRPFKVIRIEIPQNENNPEEFVLNKISQHDISDAVVKVILSGREEELNNLRESQIRSALKDANFIAGINKEEKMRGKKIEIQGYSDTLISADMPQLLSLYLDKKNISPEEKERILNFFQVFLEESQ